MRVGEFEISCRSSYIVSRGLNLDSVTIIWQLSHKALPLIGGTLMRGSLIVDLICIR